MPLLFSYEDCCEDDATPDDPSANSQEASTPIHGKHGTSSPSELSEPSQRGIAIKAVPKFSHSGITSLAIVGAATEVTTVPSSKAGAAWL